MPQNIIAIKIAQSAVLAAAQTKMTALQITRLSFWIVSFYQSRQRGLVNQPTKTPRSSGVLFAYYLICITWPQYLIGLGGRNLSITQS